MEEFEKEVDFLRDINKMNDYPYQLSVDKALKITYPLSKLSFMSNTDIKAIICENRREFR